MLFQHTLQQTTHDGDTHVGYFNTAVFAVKTRPSPSTFISERPAERENSRCCAFSAAMQQNQMHQPTEVLIFADQARFMSIWVRNN